MAVARLELERRWTLLPLGVALGVLPFVIAPLLGVPESETQGIALLLALLLGGATAILLGTSAVSGDLAGGRLGFYFSRPLAWWEIWAGKLATAAGLTLATWLLVMLPSLLVPRGDVTRFAALSDALYLTHWAGPLVLTGLVLLALGVVQWGAVAARSRSLWLMLDLVALPLVSWGFADAVVGMHQQGLHPDPWGLSILAGPIAFAFHAGAAAQMAWGRTSLTRSHAVASLTTWAVLAVLAVGWQVAARAAFRPDPSRLARAWIREPSGAGNVGVILGIDAPRFGWRGWHSYLVGPSGIRPIDLGPGVYQVAFSGDGTHVVVMSREAGGAPELLVRRLDADASTARILPVSLPSPSTPRVLVDERGRRVALLQPDAATLYDLATGAPEATLPGTEDGRVVHVVLNEDAADRLFRQDEGGVLRVEDLREGSATAVAEIGPPAEGRWRSFRLDATAERLLTLGHGEAALFATSTGTRLARFEADSTANLDGLLLSDGRVLVVEPTPWKTALRLFDAGGRVQGELDLGPARSAFVIETTPGRVVAALGEMPFSSSHLAVVDLEPLRIVRVDADLDWTPVDVRGGWRRDRPVGGTLLVTRLARLENHRIQSSVLRYDVATGSTEWVAGAR
jgi:hypothetical protein